MYAGNARVFDGLLISCLSVAAYTKEAVTAYLLTMDYTEKNPAYTPLTEEQRAYLEEVLREANPDSRAVLLDLGELYRACLAGNPNEQSSYTPYCLLRLLADRVEELPGKVLYLDTDTVLCRDAGELFHIPLDGYELAAVRDRYGKFFFGPNYCNSGVLLMNLEMLRETGNLARACRACRDKKIFLPDQTAICRCIKRRKYLPGRFNEQKKRRDDTVVRHFSKTIRWLPFFHTRNIKPWHVEQVRNILHEHSFDDILENYNKRMEQLRESHAEK